MPPLEDQESSPQEQEWPPQSVDADEPEAELPPAEDEPMTNGPPVEMMDDLPPQQIEKRKSTYPVFWNRPKAKMYKMNFDYGETYYSNMMAYLNSKSNSSYRSAVQPPKALSWAERAHQSAKLRIPKQEADLSNMLSSVRCNIRDYDRRHREYTSRVQSVYGSKAL